MVNNSTNNNKTNNHRSPRTIEHKDTPQTYGFGNPGPCFGQAQKCGRVKPVNGIWTLSLW